jgi:hypothetical protein
MDELMQARLEALEKGTATLSKAEAADADALLATLCSQGLGDAYARLALALRQRHTGWSPADRVARFTEGLRLGSDPVVRDHLLLLLASEHSIAGDRAEAALLLEGIDPA